MLPVGIFCPSVETPVRHRDFLVARIATHKNGTGIARPAAIGGPEMEFDPLQADVAAIEDGAYTVALDRVQDDDVHVLHTAEVADDIGIDPGNALELSRPVVLIARPGDPSSLMSLPLRRHAVSKFAGRQDCRWWMWSTHFQSRNLWQMPE